MPATTARSPAQRTPLSEILQTLLAGRVGGRGDLERVCRRCERRTCDRCPVGLRLDEIVAGALE